MIVNHRQQDDYLELLRQNKIPQGLGIGCNLDNHIRFKRASFNCILGHANVGKTYFVLFYLTALSKVHNLKHLIYSAENTIESLKRNILELYVGSKLVDMSTDQLETAKQWLEEHFDFVEAKEWDINKFMEGVQKIGAKYDSLMIDPHNSFTRPFGTNAHEHDYLTATKLRFFAKKFDCTVFMCMHGATEALRKTHKSGEYEGLPVPPAAADAEGGGKWINRADDFWVIHRYTQHPHHWMDTHVHIKKVKDTFTGGSCTVFDQPVVFSMQYGTQFTCGGVNVLESEVPSMNNFANLDFDNEKCPF